MDNFDRVARVLFEIEAVGKQAEINGRITNRMLKRIERNRIILNSIDDEFFQPIVTRILKVIALFREFSKAYNAGNAVDGEKISSEMIALMYECKELAERGAAN